MAKYNENGFCRLNDISEDTFLASSGDEKQGHEIEKGQNTLPIFEAFTFNSHKIGVTAKNPKGYTYNQMWEKIIDGLCNDGKKQMLVDYCNEINANGKDGWLKYQENICSVGNRKTVDIPGADPGKDALRGYLLGNDFVICYINSRWIHKAAVDGAKELGLDIWVKPTADFKKFIDNTSK